MKQYFITIQYTQSNLTAMERGLLDQVREFNGCIIQDWQIEHLMNYLNVAQSAVLKDKPRLKMVEISKYRNHMGVILVHVGNITVHLQLVSELPESFHWFLVDNVR